LEEEMKSALLVIDMQKRFYIGNAKKIMESATDAINRMIVNCRGSNQKVIWVQHESKALNLIVNSKEFEIIDSLKPESNENRIIKRRMNSFSGTGLHEILIENGIDTVIVCGYAAQYCVINTFRGSKKLNYATLMLKKGVASDSKIIVKIIETIGHAKLADEILGF
jgi:nicotinamidase-related amidase